MRLCLHLNDAIFLLLLHHRAPCVVQSGNYSLALNHSSSATDVGCSLWCSFIPEKDELKWIIPVQWSGSRVPALLLSNTVVCVEFKKQSKVQAIGHIDCINRACNHIFKVFVNLQITDSGNEVFMSLMRATNQSSSFFWHVVFRVSVCCLLVTTTNFTNWTEISLN